jgi:hypothetical protein
MAVLLVERIRSLFTSREEMEHKETRLQIPDPTEESMRR